MRWVVLWGCTWYVSLAAAAQSKVELPAGWDWYSVPLRVEGVRTGSEFVVVSVPVHLSALLRRLAIAGVADPRALRLAEDEENGKAVVFQFSAYPQPRLKERALLRGTPSQVSYLGEYGAGRTAKGVETEGDLTWSTKGGTAKDGPRRFRLYFGVPKSGRAIQVPFPPQDLRVFDGLGKGTRLPWFPTMQLHPQWPVEGWVEVFQNGRAWTKYHTGPWERGGVAGTLRRPFLYPVLGPDWIGLTEFGKPHDPTGSHAHHYSLWIAHANVNGETFWGESGGLIVHEGFDEMEDGPVFCRLVQRTVWKGAGGKALVRERRSLRFFETPEDFRVVDVQMEFTPAGTNAVAFGKTTFGFLAARVAESMTPFDGAGEILNSAGDRNEPGAHLKRAAWLDQSGPIAPGKWGGLTLFDWPENPNFPTVWHCRNDGWAGAAFNAGGATVLERGQTLRLRYGVLLHRGDAAEGKVEERFRDWSTAARVVVGEEEVREEGGSGRQRTGSEPKESVTR